jgi:hypothetical protein
VELEVTARVPCKAVLLDAVYDEMAIPARVRGKAVDRRGRARVRVARNDT